jgi:iron complex outermembrane recepter protein
MSYRRTILAASILASFGIAGAAYAQNAQTSQDPKSKQNSVQTPDAGPVASAQAADAQSGSAKDTQTLEEITVVGIRESLKRSIQTKRDADAIVDAITAEDIGKFPSTNVAEAMSQIPGVTIDRRFGQGERVSINGTDPSLNLTFLDGHPVAQTTWLYGEQPNRGFDYTLLAPEILGKLEVYKSPEARIPEGSLGGTVMMHTRQPLDLKANSLSGSVGVNYNDQSGDSKPTGSVLYSWKNDERTFGVAVSASHYEEQVDRQGEEIFGYSPVSALAGSNPAIAAQIASGALRPTDLVPQEINTAYFQQTRKRDSITLNLQFKPNDRIEFDVGALYIKEDFNNFNHSMYGFTTQTPGNITSLTEGNNGVITSGHSCGNDSPGCPGLAAGGVGPVNTYLDNQVRTSKVTSKGLDLKGSYRGDGWSLSGQLGQSKADDASNAQAFIEPYYNGGYTWDIHKGTRFDSPAAAANPANWHDGDTPGGGWGGNFGQFPAHAKDTYGQLDLTKEFDGLFNQFLFGVRHAKHDEDRELIIVGGVRTGSMATIGFDGLTDILANFPGYFNDSRHHVQTSAGAVRDWVMGSPLNFANPDPGSFLNNTFEVTQKSDAAYAQANFSTEDLHGNFGVRFVRTEITSSGYNYSGAPVLPPPAGSFQTESSTHDNVLPSFNIAYNMANDVVLRAAAAEVIAWAPYNQQVHNTFLNDTVLTGSGGNTGLSPYKSVNFDVSAEWYFANQSVLAGSLFYKNVLNYITTDSHIERQFNSLKTTSPDSFQTIYVDGHLGNCTSDGFCDYSVLRPLDGGRGTVKGATINYQQPFGDSGFGLSANYTYANGTTKSGQALPFNSKNSVNISPYYESGRFTARVTAGWRSSYLAGGYVAGAPPASVNDYTELDASVGWTFGDNWTLNLDALNLLDESYFQYLGSKDLLAGKYKSGRRYMATVHFKF